MLVLNDKHSGTWSKAVNIPLSQVPMIFGKQQQESLTFAVQISTTGYDVFVDNCHCARLERSWHPHNLQNHARLILQCPSTDDSGKREDWTLQQVWWGQRNMETTGSYTSVIPKLVPGANDFDREHPTRLFLRGLTPVKSQIAIEQRRAVLERAFAKYGGNLGVKVVVPKNKKFAFVQVRDREIANLALAEMKRHFLLSRAQRSAREAAAERKNLQRQF